MLTPPLGRTKPFRPALRFPQIPIPLPRMRQARCTSRKHIHRAQSDRCRRMCHRRSKAPHWCRSLRRRRRRKMRKYSETAFGERFDVIMRTLRFCVPSTAEKSGASPRPPNDTGAQAKSRHSAAKDCVSGYDLDTIPDFSRISL